MMLTSLLKGAIAIASRGIEIVPDSNKGEAE
jgi:hypothetical protein